MPNLPPVLGGGAHNHVDVSYENNSEKNLWSLLKHVYDGGERYKRYATTNNVTDSLLMAYLPDLFENRRMPNPNFAPESDVLRDTSETVGNVNEDFRGEEVVNQQLNPVPPIIYSGTHDDLFNKFHGTTEPQPPPHRVEYHASYDGGIGPLGNVLAQM